MQRDVPLRLTGKHHVPSKWPIYLINLHLLCRTALYADVVSNNTLAEQYRDYMVQHLGVEPEQLPTLEESRVLYDQPGCS